MPKPRLNTRKTEPNILINLFLILYYFKKERNKEGKMLLTNMDRDIILSDYVHTMQGITDEEDLQTSPDVRQFEEDYKDDAELVELMRQAKEDRIGYLKKMSLRES